MKNPLRVRFVRDVAMTGGAQAMQAACAMIGGILVARFLGPDAKGELAVLVAVGSMAVLLASFGVHQSSIYFLGRFKADRAAIVSNSTVFALVGGPVTAVCLAGLGVLFRDQLLHGIALTLFFAYLLVIPCNYFTEFTRRTILGTGRVAIYNVPDLAQGVSLSLGTAAVILLFGAHVLPIVILRVVTEVAIAVFMFAYLKRIVRIRLKPSADVLRRQIRYGLKNYTASLLWLFLASSDLVICNHFLGNAPTGVYSVAVSLGLPITLMGAVIGTLVFQRVASDDSRESRIANCNRVLRLLVPIGLVAVGLIAATAPWMIPLLYGSQFTGAVTPLLLLLPGLLALTLELVIMNFLAGEGSPPIIYWAPLIGLVLNLVPNLFVIPRWGIEGAAVTSSAAYAVVFLLALRYYLRSTGSSVGDALRLRRVDLAALSRDSGIHGGPTGAKATAG